MDLEPKTNEPGKARSDVPQPINPIGSPLWPKYLVELFVRPTRFFSSQLALGQTPYVLLVTWCYGIANAIDRIDQELFRAEMGKPRPGWEFLASIVMESWFGYWAFVLISGGVGGVFLWWFGGWWYRMRLRWAGDREADKKLARLVYVYSSFVWAGPAVITALVKTLAFANYKQAWNAPEVYSLILLIFPFWSLVTSYRGASTLFKVSRRRAQVWFLILPAIVYVVALGVIATLVALFGQ